MPDYSFKLNTSLPNTTCETWDLTLNVLATISHCEHLFSVARKSRHAPSLWRGRELNHQFANQVNNTLLFNFFKLTAGHSTPADTKTLFISYCVPTHMKERAATSLNFRVASVAQHTPDFFLKSGPLTLRVRPACIGWSVLSRSTTIRWTSKQALPSQTECLVHVSRPPPYLTRQHRRTHKHSTDDHKEQIQAGSFPPPCDLDMHAHCCS